MFRKFKVENTVSLFVNYTVVVFLIVALVSVFGCAQVFPGLRNIEFSPEGGPGYVAISNNSENYIYGVSGVVKGSILPGQTLVANLGNCIGRKAPYVYVEKNLLMPNGSQVGCGQRRIPIYLDGRTRYDGNLAMKLDHHLVLRDSSCRDDGRRVIAIEGSQSCGIFVPSVVIRVPTIFK